MDRSCSAMETTTIMVRRALAVSILITGLTCFIPIPVSGEISFPERRFPGGSHIEEMRKMQSLKTSHLRHGSVSLAQSSLSSPVPGPSFAPSPSAPPVDARPNVYRVTSYGADPTGKTDSTDALDQAISEALRGPSDGSLIDGILNIAGAEINLEGGTYTISRPLQPPTAGRGNFKIHGGTLKASDDFPEGGYLVDLTASPSYHGEYNFEYLTLRDLMLDSNFKSGGIRIVNSLRTTIDNCYISHFTTNGILVQGGHETYIRNSFLGQYITAGGDRRERNFSGTAINLIGNDNAVTDTVIFSASIGIMVQGQANTISGVHCYNKATGWGGTGIYLKLPGLTQTRIVNSYMDYTGIVAEDPVQLHISSSFFLGDAFITLKSIKGVANGVNIVDNMFSGSNKGIDIVQLDQRNGAFSDIGQVIVDRNNVKGMKVRATVARGSVQGNGTSWTVDFSPTLLFPNLVKNVQYAFSSSGSSFPNHALRNTSNNRVVIESDVGVPANVFVTVDQSS